uniref:Succinate--hydroxymethylglutarate CoA-transferase n=1 Tax=Anopheles coluzzii TaxID=1518534 RepID=A0A8W7PKQ4_ANOCL
MGGCCVGCGGRSCRLHRNAHIARRRLRGLRYLVLEHAMRLAASARLILPEARRGRARLFDLHVAHRADSSFAYTILIDGMLLKRLLPPASVIINGIRRAHIATDTGGKQFPLEGVRILDLTRIVAGPYCTMVLGDLGAEVYKIERPYEGDESRKWGPPFMRNSTDSVYFMAANRNKKSVCVNLKTGREVIYELAKKCDVLVENYVPGKLDSLGLGYETLKSIAPSLVYCSITGFGSEGPYKAKPGYDVIAASMGGLLHITGSEDGPPAKVGIAITDIATGLNRLYYGYGCKSHATAKKYNGQTEPSTTSI